MDYDVFYDNLWGNLISTSDISLDFREKNKEFIDSITFTFFNECMRSNVHEDVASRFIKNMFSLIRDYNIKL